MKRADEITEPQLTPTTAEIIRDNIDEVNGIVEHYLMAEQYGDSYRDSALKWANEFGNKHFTIEEDFNTFFKYINYRINKEQAVF